MNHPLHSPATSARLQARARAAGETGSAYLMALLVMIVLSTIGLSLALITRTEAEIGASERGLQRIFYTADWGMDASAARALAAADYGSADYTIPEDDTPAVMNLRFEIDVSPFFPVLAAPCNLCEINNVGQYGEKIYYQVTHAVSAASLRVGAVDTAVGSKTLASMLDVQPWQLTAESLFPLEDEAELAKIKF